jgi:hypothetical protein
MTLGRLALAAALMAAPGLALADEPRGCDAFRWPLDKERSALNAAAKPVVTNGGALQFASAATLQLEPLADAGLPRAPERTPKGQATFAGHFTISAPAKPGVYKLTMASAGWVDVVDNGAFLHPIAFSGAIECEGARKSVKFDLPARPLELQFSDVRDPSIAVIFTSAE